VILPEGFFPSFIGASIYQYFALDFQGSLCYWGSSDAAGSTPMDHVKHLEGTKFKIPPTPDWESAFRWLFLGKKDKECGFFSLPVEVIFHFVCQQYGS